MFYGHNDNRTENEKYLEDQLEQERQWRREAEKRREQEREQRLEERRQMRDWSNRHADDWPESLRNQMFLMGRETVGEGAEWLEEWGRNSACMYFTEGVAACRRALQIWPGEEARVADEIAALEQRIAELKDSVRVNVGKRLDQEKRYQSPGWHGISAILQDLDEDPSSWLNW